MDAFATSIKDREDLEAVRKICGMTSRRAIYQRYELYQTGKQRLENNRINDDSNDKIFITNSPSEPITTDNINSVLEIYLGNTRFVHKPEDIKPDNRLTGRTRNSFNQTRGSANCSDSSVGCFNCSRQRCSVVTCKIPRDVNRIANKITKWSELR